MSLSKDKNLINQLLRLAQAQNPPGVSPDQIKGVAKKLIDNLIQQNNNPEEGFTSEKEDSRLSTKHLVNLPALLNFLQFNGIATQGNKLVISHTPAEGGLSSGVAGDAAFLALDPNVQKLYAKYPEPDDDEGKNFQYYVYKAGLVEYLLDLQKQASENSPRGRMMRPYVGSLIKAAEQELDVQVAAQAGKPTTDPNTVLDFLPPILVPQTYDNGSNKLLQSNLASKGALFAFLTSTSTKLKNGDEVKDVKDFDGRDMCTVVQTLYLRAKRLTDTRDNAADRLYFQTISTLASTMSCPVGDAAPQAENANFKQVGYVTESGGFTDNGVAAMKNVELPLIMDQIVFDRIDRFANAFKSIYPQSTIVQTVVQALATLTRRYPQIKVQDLQTANYDELTSQISATTGNKETSAAPYIGTLSTLLQSTQQMLLQLDEMLRRGGSPGALEYKKDIDDQLQNVYRNNIYGIRTLQTQLQNKLNQLAQRR